MSIFEFRKPAVETKPRSSLGILRQTLKNLEATPTQTKQIAELKLILAARIAELERKKP